MRKKEVIEIMRPIWKDYLLTHGELERKLQFEKFVKKIEFQEFSFVTFFYLEKYISFKLGLYIIRRDFWRLTKQVAQFKKLEFEWDSFNKEDCTEDQILRINRGQESFKKKFQKSLESYFESTFGAQEREIRLFSFYETKKFI